MRPAEPPSPASVAARIERLRRLSRLMDAEWKVPLLRRRFGLDSVIGLIPGVGDLAGALVSLSIVLTAARMGASRSTLLLMLGNIGLDMLVGAVPVLGDVFDVAFKANRRNVRLLESRLGR